MNGDLRAKLIELHGNSRIDNTITPLDVEKLAIRGIKINQHFEFSTDGLEISFDNKPKQLEKNTKTLEQIKTMLIAQHEF